MSVKAIVEGIEMARVNNRKLGATFEGRINDMIAQLEEMKRAIAEEIEERDRDHIRLIDGAA